MGGKAEAGQFRSSSGWTGGVGMAALSDLGT
jgi:hypothetical protein